MIPQKTAALYLTIAIIPILIIYAHKQKKLNRLNSYRVISFAITYIAWAVLIINSFFPFAFQSFFASLNEYTNANHINPLGRIMYQITEMKLGSYDLKTLILMNVNFYFTSFLIYAYFAFSVSLSFARKKRFIFITIVSVSIEILQLIWDLIIGMGYKSACTEDLILFLIFGFVGIKLFDLFLYVSNKYQDKSNILKWLNKVLLARNKSIIDLSDK